MGMVINILLTPSVQARQINVCACKSENDEENTKRKHNIFMFSELARLLMYKILVIMGDIEMVDVDSRKMISYFLISHGDDGVGLVI